MTQYNITLTMCKPESCYSVNSLQVSLPRLSGVLPPLTINNKCQKTFFKSKGMQLKSSSHKDYIKVCNIKRSVIKLHGINPVLS